ncbi:hypothetical protein WJX81_005827 [Elliptochloris bilobata]|uniref:Phosphatidate cytidylyltransferase n=1 Tax=Elliptochloris bilobata TaxID=381761 RepID=A0AAW1S0U3_9CHLO
MENSHHVAPSSASDDGYASYEEQEDRTGQPSTSKGGVQEDDLRGVKGVTLLLNSKNKYRSLKVRTASTLVLVGSFFAFVSAGHVPLMLMIFGIQWLMVRELFKLAEHAQRQQPKPPGTGRAAQWYFFGVAAFWVYLRFIQNQLTVEVTSNARLAHLFGWLLKKHTIIAFSLYTAGFVSFVLRLEKGCYLYQFGQYAWTHLILLFVFVPSSFFVSNIFDGIIWFLLPCSLVIINDIGAYLAGFFFGRTPLIKLSPKKTWEGFLGGLVLTVLCSWLLADVMSSWSWMTCPRTDLSLGRLQCEPDEIYVPTVFALRDMTDLLPASLEAQAVETYTSTPAPARAMLRRVADLRFVARPMQLHAVVLAMFASIIAPFGGFFASGFKRGFKIKDFGDSIPGHGGMTDRMDCQVVMAMFSYLYFNSYVAREVTVTVGGVLQAAGQLTERERMELWLHLARLLAGDGLLPTSLLGRIEQAGQRAMGRTAALS